MNVAATLKYARISPQKMRLMADAIRGKSVDEAIKILIVAHNDSTSLRYWLSINFKYNIIRHMQQLYIGTKYSTKIHLVST